MALFENIFVLPTISCSIGSIKSKTQEVNLIWRCFKKTSAMIRYLRMSYDDMYVVVAWALVWSSFKFMFAGCTNFKIVQFRSAYSDLGNYYHSTAPGGDTSTQAACCGLCASRPECRSWTFFPYNGPSERTCRLTSRDISAGGVSMTSCIDCTSGVSLGQSSRWAIINNGAIKYLVLSS